MRSEKRLKTVNGDYLQMEENNIEIQPGKSSAQFNDNAVRWYVIHTYSGYENKVKTSIEMAVENRNLHDKILEVHIPIEDAIEIEDGKRKMVKRKTFPGYVFVKMIKDDETWNVVRYIKGVTGFVGGENEPVPLTNEEIVKLGIEDIQVDIDISVGENVKILSGPLENFNGTVKEISEDKQKVKVDVYMFGRTMQVDLKLNQIQKLD